MISSEVCMYVLSCELLQYNRDRTKITGDRKTKRHKTRRNFATTRRMHSQKKLSAAIGTLPYELLSARALQLAR